VTGEPVVVSHCHCLDCRRTSGSAFVTWAEYRQGQFSWVRGEPARIQTRPEVTRTFCAACGTPLTYETIEIPEEIDVTACSLDEPESVRPRDHVWGERLLSWIRLDDGLPRHDRRRPQPGPKG
jgi:hypothetical protein